MTSLTSEVASSFPSKPLERDDEAIREARKVPWDVALQRGRWDVQFWARRFLGVDIHPGQIRFAEAYLKRHDLIGWRPEYFDLAVSAGNRAGKTMALAVVVFHSCFYKMGTQPQRDDTDKERLRWLERPYIWYHFAIKQEVADHLWTEFVKFLSGTHEGQPDGCPLAEEWKAAGGGKVAELDTKENGDYRWVQFAPELGGAQIKFRTTEGSKGTGSLGRDMQGESFDEAGFEDNLVWIYKNVMNSRRLGTGGQIIFISTPEEGYSEFADLWYEGDPEAPDRKTRKWSLRISSRENVGFGLTADVFYDLIEGQDENWVKQNIDGYFIQGRNAYFDALRVDAAFTDLDPRDQLPFLEHQEAVNGHFYLQGVDPGLRDKCWSMVFDLIGDELYGVKAEWSPDRNTEAIVALAVSNHDAYSNNSRAKRSETDTAVDTTALGGHMFKDLVEQSIPHVTSVEFGGNLAVKRKLLGDWKTLIESGRVHMPRTGVWLEVRKQHLKYKLGDRKIEQDAVAACLCVARLVKRNESHGQPVTGQSFRYRAGDKQDGPDQNAAMKVNIRRPLTGR